MTRLTYGEYATSGVEWLDRYPAHWMAKPLKSITSMQNGNAITADAIDDSGEFPVYGGNGLRGFTYDFTHEGDRVLIGRQGALCGNVHLVSGQYWASEHAIVVTPQAGISPRWLAYMLRTMNLGQYSQAAAQPGIAADGIGKLRIPTPPAPEQGSIANFLDRETSKVDALISRQEQLIATLREDRTATIAQAVTKGLDPGVEMQDSGVEWMGVVPVRWSITKLAWHSSCKSGEAMSLDVIKELPDEQHSVRVVGGNGTMGYAAESNLVESALVIGRVGALCGNVHCVSGPAWVTDNALVLRLRDQVFVREYLWHVLVARNLNDIAAKTAQPLITGSQVSSQRLPLPPVVEQQEIAAFLDSRSSKIDALIAKAGEVIETLREYRSALVTDAVTGRIDVRKVL